MNNSTKKKVVSICLVVAMVATLVIGGTLAYFWDNDTAKNTFTVGDKIDLTLEEDPTDKPEEKDLPDDIDPEDIIQGKAKLEGKGLDYTAVPGGVYAKMPKVTLTGAKAHVYMELTISDAAYKALESCLTGGAADFAKMVVFPKTLATQPTQFAYKSDGQKCSMVFYYGELAPSATPYVLMSAVRIPSYFKDPQMEALKAVSPIDLDVTAYALQAEGGVTKDVAMTEFFSGYTPAN